MEGRALNNEETASTDFSVINNPVVASWLRYLYSNLIFFYLLPGLLEVVYNNVTCPISKLISCLMSIKVTSVNCWNLSLL